MSNPHTRTNTHTLYGKQKGNNVVINKITLKYKAKKNERRNKFDTNASTRMTQKRQQPKNPHRPSNGSPLP